jgi:predicted methyltransferase
MIFECQEIEKLRRNADLNTIHFRALDPWSWVPFSAVVVKFYLGDAKSLMTFFSEAEI